MLLRLVMGFWLLAALGSGGRAMADPLAGRQGKRVKAIELRGAEESGLSDAEGRQYIDIRPGDRFSIQAVRRSVKLLYHLGLFGRVWVTSREVEGGLELTFHLASKRRVLMVEFIGCEALDEDELARIGRLQRGEEYDHWKMEAHAADILTLYHNRGYRRARIVAKAQDAERGDLEVRYYIQEGPPTRISRIWFRGQTAFAHARLRGVMDLDRGDVLGERRLEQALERLRSFYYRQRYLEARVTAPKLEPGLQALWEVVPIEIQTGPRVRFRFEGNQVFTGKKLRARLEVEGGVELSRYALRDLTDRIEGLYRRHGYDRVEVTSSVRTDQQRILKEVLFRVEEGPQVTVRSLRFEGNQAFSDEQLRAYVHDAMIDAVVQSGLAQPIDRGDLDPLGGGHPLRGRKRRVRRPQGFLFELVPETMYLREPYVKALDTIEDLYLGHGYLDVSILTPLLSYDATGANLYITVPIREGPQTRVESISFSGNHAIAADELLAVADRLDRYVKPGGPLDQYGVEVLRKELSRTYARQGYLFCRVGQDVLFSDDRSLAEVRYRIDEGPRVLVGRVLVRGNLVTDQKVFDSVLQLRPGEVYSPDKMAASQEGLQLLGVFSATDIKILDPDVVEPVKDVVVHVRERLPHHLALGPGISSAEGVRMGIEYTHRNLFGYALESVNRAKINYQVFYKTPLVDKSLQKRFSELSFLEGLEWQVLSGLHWPRMWFLGKDLAGRLDVVGLRDHAPSFDLTKVSITPGVDFKWTRDLALTLEYELEFIDLECPFREQDEETPCGGSTNRWLRYDEGSLLLGSFRSELSWDRRDNPFNPHSGILVFLRAELATSFTMDQPVFFGKLDGQVTGYIPLSRRTTLALSARAGSIFHLKDDSRTPSHKLFFLGGRNTVRSFSEEDLIPADQDPLCFTIRDKDKCVSAGGNVYVMLKAELRFPLFTELLEGALFFDAGNLWVRPENAVPFDLRPAAGVGLRLSTPIGPLAFDLGFNLMPDEERGEGAVNLHFNVGVF